MKKSAQQHYLFVDSCFGKKTSHIPVWFMRQAGRYLPGYRKIREKHDVLTICTTPELATEVVLEPIKILDVDAAIIFSDIILPAIAMGFTVDIVDAIGPVISNPITTSSDVAKLLSPNPKTDFLPIANQIKMLLEKLPSHIALIGFSGAPFTLAGYLIEGKPSRDFSQTKKIMYGQPDLWHSLMDKLTKTIIEYLQTQIQAGVHVIQLFDTWVGCLSAQSYQEFVFPYSKKIFEQLKHFGIPSIHFGTGTGMFLKTFASVGCDVIGLDFRVPIDVGWKVIGFDKAIQGNVDPAVLLCDTIVIQKHVDAIIDTLPQRQGFIFNLGHGVLPQTPKENLIWLTQYVHQQ